jgi:hypothetical protein
MAFGSRNASMPYLPYSRPTPEYLNPPQGACELQAQLSNPFDLAVTVAHYPTGTSKWNPIEHRLFSEISKNWAAEPLDSYQKILNFLPTTTTKTGLAVSAYLDRAHYPTGLDADPLLFRSLRLRPHETLPAWNYKITPNL